MNEIETIIQNYTMEKLKFIQQVRNAFEKMEDEIEKKSRLEVFDTLLLLATYAPTQTLEDEFSQEPPLDPSSKAITYIRQQLREINGFCTGMFSDAHQGYQNIISKLSFPTPKIKQNIHEMLSTSVIEMIVSETKIPAQEAVLS